MGLTPPVPKKLITRAGATPPKHQRISKSALLIVEEIENICAYLGWIGVPALLPMAIDLPRNTRKPVSMLGTPLADSPIRLAQTRVWAKMDGAGHASRR